MCVKIHMRGIYVCLRSYVVVIHTHAGIHFRNVRTLHPHTHVPVPRLHNNNHVTIIIMIIMMIITLRR